MQQSKAFEKTISTKQQSMMFRQQAILERDLARLQEQNQKCSFLAKSILLFILLLSICIAIPTVCSLRFTSIMNAPENCHVALYDAQNYFHSVCKICQQNWELRDGLCWKII